MPLSNDYKDINPFKEDHLSDSPYGLNNSDNSIGSSPDDKDIKPISEDEKKRSSEISKDKDIQEKEVKEGLDGEKAEKFNHDKTKIFMTMLAKAFKRAEIRKQAHHDFHKHVDYMRNNLAKSKMPKKLSPENIDSYVGDLKKKVSYLVELENDPDAKPGFDQAKFVKDKITELEAKLNALMKSKEEKEKRYAELDNKINLKLNADKRVVEEMERKLLVLQKKVIEHKILNKTRKKFGKKPIDSDIDEIHERIKITKDALENIKKKKRLI